MANRRSTAGRRARNSYPSSGKSAKRRGRAAHSALGRRASGGTIGNVAGLGSGSAGSASSDRAGRTAGAHAKGSATGLGGGSLGGIGGGLGAGTGAGGARSKARQSGRVRMRTGGAPFGSGGADGSQGLPITRRTLILGAVGIGAVAAIGGGVAVATSQSRQSDDITVLEVPADAVTSTDDLGDAEAVEDHMTRVGSYDLTYGTLVWACDDQVAACLIPSETANPLCQVGILSLGNGNVTTVLDSSVGATEGFQIYDARATANGVVWIEADILEGSWRVYTARLSSDLALGTPALADEGGGDWETPSIAAAGGYAYWQVLPKLDTDSSSENSLVKRTAFGSGDAEEVYSSPGRLATPPYSTGDEVVITPRVDASGTYYQLTCLDAATAQVTDTLVLPQGMAPTEAGYGKNGFMFCFDAIYDYGDGISNLGTYCPSSDAAQSDYSAVPWFRFSRTPSAAPAWCGNYLMVKSTNSVCGVDMSNSAWFSLGVESGTDDYGDYLASSGTRTNIVTYSNIDHTPLNGEQIHTCRVSVWQTA